MIVAGEASGDLHAANLVRALKRRQPGLRFSGIGGAEMRSAHVETHYDIDRLAAVGLFEVFGRLPWYRRVFADLAGRVRRERPNALILVDFPDFNLRLVRKAKRWGVPAIYFIGPQVWAWRKGRLKTIRKCVDKMLVVLPFEEAFYRQAGVDAEYVGHPLTSHVKTSLTRAQARAAFGLDPARPTVGLLPGSRRREVRVMFPIMLEAARKLREERPGMQFILPLAPSVERSQVEDLVERSGLGVAVADSGKYDAMSCADFLVAVSGTITLEAGLLQIPMLIIYRGDTPSYLLFALGHRVPLIGLVNVIAGKAVVPELRQFQVTPANIVKATLAVLDDPVRYRRTQEELGKVADALGRENASERAAECILAHLARTA